MSTPIVIEPVGGDSYGYQFQLKGIIDSSTIEALGSSIQSLLETEEKKLRILIIDITGADDVLIKPTRLFSLCDYYLKYIVINRLNIQFSLLFNNHQKVNFDGIERICDKGIISIDNSLSIKILSYIDPYLLYKFVVLPIFIISICCFLLGVFFITNRLLGFSLAFSGGILIYESFLVLKLIKSKKPTKEKI